MTDHRDYGDETKEEDLWQDSIEPIPEGIIDRIEWYVQCLKDFADRKPVRGLAEAKAGYDSAIQELKEIS